MFLPAQPNQPIHRLVYTQACCNLLSHMLSLNSDPCCFLLSCFRLSAAGPQTPTRFPNSAKKGIKPGTGVGKGRAKGIGSGCRKRQTRVKWGYALCWWPLHEATCRRRSEGGKAATHANAVICINRSMLSALHSTSLNPQIRATIQSFTTRVGGPIYYDWTISIDQIGQHISHQYSQPYNIKCNFMTTNVVTSQPNPHPARSQPSHSLVYTTHVASHSLKKCYMSFVIVHLGEQKPILNRAEIRGYEILMLDDSSIFVACYAI